MKVIADAYDYVQASVISGNIVIPKPAFQYSVTAAGAVALNADQWPMVPKQGARLVLTGGAGGTTLSVDAAGY